MASYIYSYPPQNTNQHQERVVVVVSSSESQNRGGRYLGGTVPPLVFVVPRIKRTK